MSFWKKGRTGLYLFLLLLVQTTFAQNRVVNGRVTDATGAPVAGATVSAKGSNQGVITNDAGRFSISVAPSTNTLVVSSTGFAAREVALTGAGEVNIQLASVADNLGEVVVVAYGTRKKSDLTGAVTSIGTKEFQKGNINSAEQLLVGKVAGLSVTTGGGAAGGGSRIRIRGGASLNASNDPLIVIDGVPVEGNGIAGSANLLNTINPNDIESFTVLKDASAAALYGSRASNGVLIITTKKGTKGKIRYNYNNLFAVGSIVNTVPVLTGDEIRSIVNADAAATGNNTYRNLLGTANTDWQSEIYQLAPSFDNTVSASGMLGKVPFRASMGYLTQDGILRTNHFNRLTGALNLSPKFFND
ncbi:MAG: TonB-dependent receptor plug domain-containing protein, partial [Chitinophagaceae bacterium]|nr:TonB-dependent receptor plug domain-containing protein [Chitinophagaceae bacterium]